MDFGVVVVGGGAVGLAVAARLAREDRPLLVVEREERLGAGTSSRNSGVIHAGIHHPQEWLKSRLCIEGRRALYAFCERTGVPHRRCGKLVVAQDDAEAGHLETILARGRAAGVEGLELWDAARVAAAEPAIHASAALHSPESGIVDPHALMDALAADARGRGAVLQTATRLEGVAREPGGFRLALREGSAAEPVEVTSEAVVNAAGLDADRVAALALDEGIAPRQHFVKGTWWRIAPRHRGKISRLVYPVPLPRLVGLGIHLTLELDGGQKLGPDVEWLDGHAEDYGIDAGARDRFLSAASRYLPWLRAEDLSPDMAGIRAKLSARGEPARDFSITEESSRGAPGFINLLGIESPGLTACLAIAAEVERLIGG